MVVKIKSVISISFLSLFLVIGEPEKVVSIFNTLIVIHVGIVFHIFFN